MTSADARLEIWYPSMDEVSIFTEVPGDGSAREMMEVQLFAAFAASMMMALGKSPAKGHLCDGLQSLSGIGAENVNMGALKIVPATASKGRKGFEGTLLISAQSLRMKVKPKGFGVFGRGTGFYGPMAVYALFLQLHGRQSPSGQSLLTRTAEIVGYLGSANKLSPGREGEAAAAAVDSALAELDAPG